jgi:hypothetical protein
MPLILKGEKKKKRKALSTCNSDDEKPKDKLGIWKEAVTWETVSSLRVAWKEIFFKDFRDIDQERNRTIRV